jgi:NADPH-dependent curcumin reductase CurA
MVIQLCQIKGVRRRSWFFKSPNYLNRLKTIGSASTDAKVEFMRSIGADVAFNYKKTPVAAALSEHGPIDLYFDNVGREQL